MELLDVQTCGGEHSLDMHLCRFFVNDEAMMFNLNRRKREARVEYETHFFNENAAPECRCVLIR